MKYIVRISGGYAVKFHRNLCGNVYSVVADGEATQFTSVTDAARTAFAANLRATQMTVETLSPSPQTAGAVAGPAVSAAARCQHANAPAGEGAL